MLLFSKSLLRPLCPEYYPGIFRILLMRSCFNRLFWDIWYLGHLASLQFSRMEISPYTILITDFCWLMCVVALSIIWAISNWIFIYAQTPNTVLMTRPMTKGQCRWSARKSQKRRIPTGHSSRLLGKHTVHDGQNTSTLSDGMTEWWTGPGHINKVNRGTIVEN